MRKILAFFRFHFTLQRKEKQDEKYPIQVQPISVPVAIAHSFQSIGKLNFISFL